MKSIEERKVAALEAIASELAELNSNFELVGGKSLMLQKELESSLSGIVPALWSIEDKLIDIAKKKDNN